MSEALSFSALYDQAPPDDLLISISEVTDRGMIDLRGLTADRKFMAAAKSALGFDLPKTPRSSVSKGKIECLWLSVDQWLITCPRKDAGKLQEKLIKAMGDIHGLVTDLSDARTIIRLEGEQVRQVLMKGSSVDFTDPAYAAGTVRRMLFAEIAAMAHIVSEDPETVDLYVFRSYARYTWAWLIATSGQGSQFGLPGNLTIPETV